jgi:predicted double-glycine peptidase
MSSPTFDQGTDALEAGLPLPANLVEVPFVQQAQDFSCGAAATLLLLRFWCVERYAMATEGDLYGPLRTTRARGTEPEPMVDMMVACGLKADYRSGDVRVEDLESAVRAREPPIVDLQAWSDHAAPWAATWDAGHYVVLVGFDAEHLFFADPSRATPGGYAFLQRAEFVDRWHDLAGDDDRPLERMSIFVRGETRCAPATPRSNRATRLG